jgi:hypothetical protein
MSTRTRLNSALILVATALLLAGLAVPGGRLSAEEAPSTTPADVEASVARGQPAPTLGQAAAPGAPAGESEADELSRRATDPTASPPNLSLIGDWATSYRDLDDGTPIDEDGFELRFQPVVPFVAWGQPNILRLTIPYQLSGPGPNGLGDVTIFDLLIFGQSWGRLGVGAVGNLVQSEKDADGHFAGGPAIGFVVVASKKLNWGLFNQNLFGKGVQVSQLQPILAYQLGNGWSLSLGDLQFPYDWDRGEFVSLPIGLQLGKVLPVASQPMRFAVNPQYDLKDIPGATRFKVLFTVTLLLPEGKK